MSSGVRFIEEYTGKDDVSRLAADTFRQVGTGGVEAVTPFNVRIASSGTRFYYASVETQVLGLVLRNAVGRPVADDLQEKIWEPIGAEADARPGSSTARARRQRSAALMRCCATMHAWDCCSPTTGVGAAGKSSLRPGSRRPRLCGQASRSPLPAATAIRSGYWRASGGCSRSAAYVARRSTSIRRVGSSWSTRRSGNRHAIQVSGRRTRSGGAWCNSSAIDREYTEGMATTTVAA